MGLIELSWENVNGKFLIKSFSFTDFLGALKFVNICGEICEEQDHHAEFTLSWGDVTVKTWSHDTDSVTDRDTTLADAIDGAYSNGS